ncbi:serine hydrolase [Actinocatenispora thailandica]|uniref:Serine hydrolase n=1 Tax=Actinocatenispora thailandica TaxID=227318 RepID=A0A7R7DX45_9ACTN|nr:serine hydrolase domain-containing protein [Actinocatenispora thailandica]BCJ39296.1 serine hydrolase [Actinocatenispora thailandica]
MKTSGPDFPAIWRVLDEQVAAGRLPGYVAAVRIRGAVEVHAGGRTAIEPDSAPMGADTQFRIASVTKPIGAALTLGLVHDGVLGLADPVTRWLPELADHRVLTAPDAPLDSTVPAVRAITVRDLLTMRSGWGVIFEPTPLQREMARQQVSPGPLPPPMTGDEFVARIGALPAACQPGAGWLYDTSMDLLGVALERATGTSLVRLVADRIAGPLGLASTGFWATDPARLATAYLPGPDGPTLLDPPDGMFAAEPAFRELSSGLVSTAPDLLRCFTALADGGAPILPAAAVAAMTTDAITPAQREQGAPILGPGTSWGLGTGVEVAAARPWQAAGAWGWDGGTGTTVRVDPSRELVGVLLTQRGMAGPQDGFDPFWSAVAAAC